MPYCVNPRCYNQTESATHCSSCSSSASSSAFYPPQAKHDGSKIKLVYFENIWGRAEPIRWALSVAGIPFEDARLPWEEFNRQSEAGEFPYATLPTMYVGDRQIGQSRAALRYVGRVGGLYPEDPVTAGQCDAVIDALADLMLQLGPSMRAKNPDEKKTMREALLPVFAEYFNYFEHALARNTSGSGYYFDKLSIADLESAVEMYRFLDGDLDYVPTNIMDNFPKLKAHTLALRQHPKIAAWIQAHP